MGGWVGVFLEKHPLDVFCGNSSMVEASKVIFVTLRVKSFIVASNTYAI